MATNPNNAVGTNGAFGGRTSVNAFNDDLSAYSAGIMSGWACSPSSGLTVVLGGDGTTRDVAIAEDNAGNKTTINNISGSPISVTVGNAPNNNSRIDSIVAYVDNPPQGSATATDNYGACGLIVVSGAVASTPVAPNDSAIRTAITADGASGTTAYYVVLANVTVASGTTDIVSDNIASGNVAKINGANIDPGACTAYNSSTTSVAIGQTTATEVLSVDISALPVGAKFVVNYDVCTTGTATLTAVVAYARYNGVDDITFRQCSEYAKTVSGMGTFTKVSGVNAVIIRAYKDNSSTVNLSAASALVTIIG